MFQHVPGNQQGSFEVQMGTLCTYPVEYRGHETEIDYGVITVELKKY